MSMETNENDFEQAVFDRLDRIIDLLARGAAARPAFPAGVSPATEAARRYAAQIVPEPARPGQVGVIRIRGWRVGTEHLDKTKRTLDLWAEGEQYRQFPFLRIAEAFWSNPALVPAHLEPEHFEVGDESACRGIALYKVSDKKNKEGNYRLNVLAFHVAANGEPLPDWESGEMIPDLPSPTPAGGNGTATTAEPRPANGPESPAGNVHCCAAANAFWRREHALTILGLKTTAGMDEPEAVQFLNDLEARGIVNRQMGKMELRTVALDAATGIASAPPGEPAGQEPAAPPPDFDRGAALNHWLTRGGLLIAELKQRFFPDALAAAGFLADLEAQGLIDRDEDANVRAQKALAAAAKRAGA